MPVAASSSVTSAARRAGDSTAAEVGRREPPASDVRDRRAGRAPCAATSDATTISSTIGRFVGCCDIIHCSESALPACCTQYSMPSPSSAIVASGSTPGSSVLKIETRCVDGAAGVVARVVTGVVTAVVASVVHGGPAYRPMRARAALSARAAGSRPDRRRPTPGESITASVTSRPRCAGRQCMNSASGSGRRPSALRSPGTARRCARARRPDLPGPSTPTRRCRPRRRRRRRARIVGDVDRRAVARDRPARLRRPAAGSS